MGRGGDVTTAEIIARARRAGIALEVKDGALHLGGNQSHMAPDLIEEIRQRREEVIAWLTAMAAWEKTLGEVSAKWNAYKESHGDAPWLPAEEDDTLQAEVGEAIRRCDLERALKVMTSWREAWEDLLSADEARQQGTGVDRPCQEVPPTPSLADTFDDSPGAPSVIRMFEEAEKRYKRARGEDR